jgi:hypothetical protein
VILIIKVEGPDSQKDNPSKGQKLEDVIGYRRMTREQKEKTKEVLRVQMAARDVEMDGLLRASSYPNTRKNQEQYLLFYRL